MAPRKMLRRKLLLSRGWHRSLQSMCSTSHLFRPNVGPALRHSAAFSRAGERCCSTEAYLPSLSSRPRETSPLTTPGISSRDAGSTLDLEKPNYVRLSQVVAGLTSSRA